MSTGALGGTLRHLRDLFGDGTAVGLGDGQLLARFAGSGDQAAFEALVARHGPMVLATCRAVLKHEHDVEDAFQATFLVLARKARSVRVGDALGGWLHRVAYRAAVQLSADLKRRRHCESQAAMTTLHANETRSEPDVAPIVHEELDRLPEKLRLPLVLCDLEGLTYEQAAIRLRWTEPTLRHRLLEARRRLRGRLARRGVTAGAMGAVMAASAAGARAAVPPALVRATVAAAAGGTASLSVAVLAGRLARGLLMGRVGRAAAGLLVVAVMASAGTVAFVALGGQQPDGAMKVKHPAAAAKKHKPPAEIPASAETVEVRGRVVDPKGRPVAGASVRMYRRVGDDQPDSSTKSGPDGRFTLRVRLLPIQAMLRRPGAMFPRVVATAPGSGYGPGWISSVPEPGAPEEATLQLAEPGPPIEGRIIDLEGRPVAGARVKVDRIWLPRDSRLADWLARAAELGSTGPWDGLAPMPADLLDAVTTGPDGRFRLEGLGADRLAQLIVSAPAIATAQLWAANVDGATVHAVNLQPIASSRSRTTYYSRRFEYAAVPSRPIEGTIVDRDSGRPIAGLKIEGMVYEKQSSIPAPGVEAATDEKGHYRLIGLPDASSYRLFIHAGGGRPYPAASFVVRGGSPRPDPVRFDMTLKRGVIVRGRLTDKSTGQPVAGMITPFAFLDNPQAAAFPGHDDANETFAPIDDDGRFEVVVLPGPGILACYASAGLYRRGAGARSIRAPIEPIGNSQGAFRTMPSLCLIDNYHVLAAIDFAPGVESVTRDIQVEPGGTVTLHVEDPDGRPLAGTTARGVSDVDSTFDVPQESSTVVIHALDPADPRRVVIRHEGRKLIGGSFFKGDETGERTIRLRPWGVVTGRLVDDDDRPMVGVHLRSMGGFGPQAPAEQAMLPGAGGEDGLAIGRDGRFRIEGLVPGLKYGARVFGPSQKRLGVAFRELVVAPGQVKDLGDVQLKPFGRGQ